MLQPEALIDRIDRPRWLWDGMGTCTATQLSASCPVPVDQSVLSYFAFLRMCWRSWESLLRRMPALGQRMKPEKAAKLRHMSLFPSLRPQATHDLIPSNAFMHFDPRFLGNLVISCLYAIAITFSQPSWHVLGDTQVDRSIVIIVPSRFKVPTLREADPVNHDSEWFWLPKSPVPTARAFDH